jgi:hypothetical protein
VDRNNGTEQVKGSAQKRSREEQKQDKLRRVSIDQQRKNRGRELERILKLMKEEECQQILNRKITASLLLERLAKEEADEVLAHVEAASSSSSTLPSSSSNNNNTSITPPSFFAHHSGHDNYPLGRPLHLSDKTFGNCLELWVFLFTYSKPLHLALIPSQETFEKIFSFYEPLTRYLKYIQKKSLQLIVGYKVSLSPPPPHTTLAVGTQPLRNESYRHLMNKVGLALSRPLLEEYYKIMGMESFMNNTMMMIGDEETSSTLPMNEILWKEIIRVVLLYTLCRSYQMSEYETITCLKGKGYSISGGDIHEKRIMKLIKRRISQRYRHHHQHNLQRGVDFTLVTEVVESRSTHLYSYHPHLGQEFHSGLIVSVPTPGLYLPSPLDNSPSLPLQSTRAESDLMMLFFELFYLLFFFDMDPPSPSPPPPSADHDHNPLQQTKTSHCATSLLMTAHEIILSLLSASPITDQVNDGNPQSSTVIELLHSLKSQLCLQTCRGPSFYSQLKSTLLYVLQKMISQMMMTASSASLSLIMMSCARDIISYPTPAIFTHPTREASSTIDEEEDVTALYEWTLPETVSLQTQCLITQIKSYGSHLPSAHQMYHSLTKMSASATAICLYNHEQHRLLSHGGGQDEEQLGSSSPLVEKDDDGDELETPVGENADDLLIESEESRATREAVQLLSLSELSRRSSNTHSLSVIILSSHSPSDVSMF